MRKDRLKVLIKSYTKLLEELDIKLLQEKDYEHKQIIAGRIFEVEDIIRDLKYQLNTKTGIAK